MTPILKAACRSYICASRELTNYQREHGIVIHDEDNPHVKHWRATWGRVNVYSMIELNDRQRLRLAQRLHRITVLG